RRWFLGSFSIGRAPPAQGYSVARRLDDPLASLPGRVAVVVQGLSGGGAERVLRAWIDGLVDRGVDVVVVVYDPLRADPPEDVRVVNLAVPRGARFRSVRLLRRLRRVIRSHRVDAILAIHTYSSLLSLAAFPAGRRPCILVSERTVPAVYLRGAGLAGRL